MDIWRPVCVPAIDLLLITPVSSAITISISKWIIRTDLGSALQRLSAGTDIPDSVFVEDLAVICDEVAIVTRPGAASRRREAPAIAEALGRYRPLRCIEPPATIDGGDVLVIGRRVLIGQSSR